eukprot:2702326-Pleurochrysis_carterae.AAC.3
MDARGRWYEGPWTTQRRAQCALPVSQVLVNKIVANLKLRSEWLDITEKVVRTLESFPTNVLPP